MNKTASMKLAQIVAIQSHMPMHKSAGIWDDIVSHIKDNKKHYIRGGVGALAGAGLAGIINPKSLGAWISGALGGAGVGVGGGMLYDRILKTLRDRNRQIDTDGDMTAVSGDVARSTAKAQDIDGYTPDSDLAPGDTPEDNTREWGRLNKEKADIQRKSINKLNKDLSIVDQIVKNTSNPGIADKIFSGELPVNDLRAANNFRARYVEHVRRGEEQSQRHKSEVAGKKDLMDALRERGIARAKANQKAYDKWSSRKQYIDETARELFNRQFAQLSPDNRVDENAVNELRDSVYRQATYIHDGLLQKKSPRTSLLKMLFGE